MEVALLGVRGSTTAPGAEFVRYGGQTSCAAVLDDAGEPVLVLDGGTGVRDLSRLLGGRPYTGSVVLSHLHWDHLHGLPFSPALDHRDARVRLFLPAQPAGESAHDLLSRVMSPPFFPIGPEGLLGSWDVRPARSGELDAGPARVRVAPVLHKGGTTLAVRVDLGGRSVGYVPDHTLAMVREGDLVDRGDDDVAALELLAGVDVLLHDGQFTAAEARLAADYGHSTIEDALRWADRLDAGRVVLTHHAPARTDDQLDDLAGRYTRTPGGRPASFARQGAVLRVAGADQVSTG